MIEYKYVYPSTDKYRMNIGNRTEDRLEEGDGEGKMGEKKRKRRRV
jgi:hypothetical protein